MNVSAFLEGSFVGLVLYISEREIRNKIKHTEIFQHYSFICFPPILDEWVIGFKGMC